MTTDLREALGLLADIQFQQELRQNLNQIARGVGTMAGQGPPSGAGSLPPADIQAPDIKGPRISFGPAEPALREFLGQLERALPAAGETLSRAINQSVQQGFMAIFPKIETDFRARMAQALGPVGTAFAMLLEEGIDFKTKWNAIGQQVVQTFERVGETTKDQASTMGAVIADLGARYDITAGEVRGLASTLADAGINAQRALAPLNTEVLGLGGSAIETLALLDRVFELNQGTVAKTVGEAARLTKQGFDSAVSDAARLGMAVRDSGGDFGALLGVIQQVNQALRLQGDDISSLGSFYLRARDAASAFTTDASKASQLSTDALRDFGTATARMNVGLQGVVAQSMLQRAGAAGLGEGGRLEAGVALATGRLEELAQRLGAKSPVEDVLTGTLRTFQELFGGYSFERRFLAVQKIGGVQDPGAAGIIASLIDRRNESLTAAIAAASADDRKALERALGTEADKRTPFKQLGDQLELAIGNMAAGLVMTVWNATTAIVNAIQYLSQKLRGDPLADTRWDIFWTRMTQQQDTASAHFAAGLKVALPDDIKNAVRQTHLPSNEELAAAGYDVTGALKKEGRKLARPGEGWLDRYIRVAIDDYIAEEFPGLVLRVEMLNRAIAPESRE